MSGAALAEAMAARGHSWHQQTVSRVESLAQPLRLNEAEDVAKILETSLDRLMWTSPEASAVERLYSAGHQVRLAYEAVADAAQRLLLAADTATRAAAGLEQDESPRVQEAREDTLGRVRER